MKAYRLHCDYDDHGQLVVFAERGRDLRGSRGGETCDCEFISLHVRRAPEFDKYAPGPVTIPQYLAEGWWWECSGCEAQCHEDEKPIVTGTQVFCSRKCFDEHLAYCRGIVSEGYGIGFVEAVAEMEAWLAAKPGAGTTTNKEDH